MEPVSSLFGGGLLPARPLMANSSSSHSHHDRDTGKRPPAGSALQPRKTRRLKNGVESASAGFAVYEKSKSFCLMRVMQCFPRILLPDLLRRAFALYQYYRLVKVSSRGTDDGRRMKQRNFSKPVADLIISFLNCIGYTQQYIESCSVEGAYDVFSAILRAVILCASAITSGRSGLEAVLTESTVQIFQGWLATILGHPIEQDENALATVAARLLDASVNVSDRALKEAVAAVPNMIERRTPAVTGDTVVAETMHHWRKELECSLLDRGQLALQGPPDALMLEASVAPSATGTQQSVTLAGVPYTRLRRGCDMSTVTVLLRDVSSGELVTEPLYPPLLPALGPSAIPCSSSSLSPFCAVPMDHAGGGGMPYVVASSRNSISRSPNGDPSASEELSLSRTIPAIVPKSQSELPLPLAGSVFPPKNASLTLTIPPQLTYRSVAAGNHPAGAGPAARSVKLPSRPASKPPESPVSESKFQAQSSLSVDTTSRSVDMPPRFIQAASYGKVSTYLPHPSLPAPSSPTDLSFSAAPVYRRDASYGSNVSAPKPAADRVLDASSDVMSTSSSPGILFHPSLDFGSAAALSRWAGSSMSADLGNNFGNSLYQ